MNELSNSSGLHADSHTLFVEPVIKKRDNYKVFVGAFNEDSNKINETWNKLLNAKPDDTLELRIASPGGLVTECQMYINIMNNKFHNRTTAYIDSHASSAGAFTFCAAHKRVIFENSRLMLHNYSGGHQGKHQDMKDRMKFDTGHIIPFLKSTLKIGKNGYLNKKEFKKMVKGKNWWFNAKDMCERNIATHILIDGEEFTAKEYLKKIK